MTRRLAPDEIRAAIAALPGWSHLEDRNAIGKTFRFAGFSQAFAFMTRVAMEAEKQNHHPDWSNSYRTVEVALSTHAAGGITERDVRLAEVMERILADGD